MARRWYLTTRFQTSNHLEGAHGGVTGSHGELAILRHLVSELETMLRI